MGIPNAGEMGYNGPLGYGDTANRGDGPNEMGDDLPAVDLGTDPGADGTSGTADDVPYTATAIVAVHNYTCALLSNGDAKCWGNGGVAVSWARENTMRPVETGQAQMGDNLPAIDLGNDRSAALPILADSQL